MNTTTSKSIEELKAELAIAENNLYEEKQAIMKAEREAKYKAERIAQEEKDKLTMLKWEAVAKEIVKELKVAGFANANYIMSDTGKYPAILCFADDHYPAWNVSFDESYSRSFYGSSYETKIKVGQPGSSNNYPQLKAGGFNYKKIAATAWEKYQNAVALQKRVDNEKNNEKSNEVRVNRLKKQYGKPSYKGSDTNSIDNVGVSYYTFRNAGPRANYIYRADNDLMLNVKHISEEQAAMLIQFMIDNGIIKNEEK